jgi:hypothetical protein
LTAILTALKANNIVIEFKAKTHYRYVHPALVAQATYKKGSLTLRVEEPATRRARPLTAAEARDRRKTVERGYTYYQHDRWIQEPSGKPQLVYGYGKGRRLNENILPIVKFLTYELKRLHEEAVKSELDARHEKAKFLLKLRPLRHQIWTKRQLKRIEEEAEQWQRAERLRNYVAQLKATGDTGVNEDWLQLASAMIDRICPIRSGRCAVRENLPKYAEVRELWRQRYEDY